MLLTILKIILYIILILLLVILLLLAVILLARLKYSINGEYDDSGGKFELLVKASWLFGLVKAEYCHGGENEGLKLTLPFGIGKKKQKERPENNENNENNKTETYEEKTEEEFSQPEDSAETEQPEENDEVSFSEEDLAEIQELAEEQQKKRRPQKEKRDKADNKESFIEKIKKKNSDYEKFKETYDIPLLIKNAFNCIIGLIKGLGIKKGSISGILGFSDPSQTGTAMGILSIANIYLPVDININGCFEKKRIALNGEIYGKTYLFRLLWPVLAFIFKNPARTIICDFLFKKDDKENNKKDKRKRRRKTQKREVEKHE